MTVEQLIEGGLADFSFTQPDGTQTLFLCTRDIDGNQGVMPLIEISVVGHATALGE